MNTVERELRVCADHPALAGHFPGHPVVPGVVLVELALRAAEDWLQRPLPLRRLPQVKFVAPLRPEQRAVLRLRADGARIAFELRRDDAPIAQGTLEVGEVVAA